MIEFPIIPYNPLLSLTIDNGLFNVQFENAYDNQGFITTSTSSNSPEFPYTYIYKQL